MSKYRSYLLPTFSNTFLNYQRFARESRLYIANTNLDFYGRGNHDTNSTSFINLPIESHENMIPLSLMRTLLESTIVASANCVNYWYSRKQEIVV